MSTPSPATSSLLAWLMILAGAVCIVFGLALMAGVGGGWHPVLASDGAGIVLLVSGIALAGSGAFPLVFARLAADDDTRQ
ncbi:MAG: hypothetical protein DWQ11_00175 [Proteobacteria bacterium]|nr:MAG: hypothetical protein DWQ11_00175 [Pseudomonadota bacterium]